MKKIALLLSVLFILLLAACGGGETEDNNTSDSGENQTTEITVGASSTPHAEILEQAKPLLEEDGIILNIEEYQDYVLPNDDLANGELDANYFQHTPFLQQTISDTGYDLESIGGVHVEPMGVYSQGIESVDAIEEGTEVIMSNSIPDHGRILSLFESAGLITLKEDVEKSEATLEDIEENPKNLEFSPDYAAEFLPELYHNEENALVAINTNYAIGADLNPLEDALFIEGEDSEYVNVVAVKSEDADKEELNRLVEVLQSEEIQDFILEEYEGAIVPVGGDN
ncbi:MetQ/NlpA family ABC transporter substrate-binding protein [Virgibacillus xinjiangensis]|uniref:Lipoprotein n=1 Tax=Virgibacillus xinjiangensis TaxID=393090 RepID=A0ABV7CXZ8_9BACI